MRKLGLIITLWTALLFNPLSSFALGLGEIEVSSFLNQPLKAEIEVISARPGEIDDLLVGLASRDAFRKAGLERPSDLSKLRFKVEKSEDGQTAKILISTKTPVKEPFLNFLVEADWAKGRLLREFTVLLDPPYFAPQPEPAAPEVTPEQAEAVSTQPADTSPVTESTPTVSEAEPVSQPIALSEDATAAEENIPYVDDTAYLQEETYSDEIVVNKGDTLWGIASRFKDEAHSMAQVMLAMQAMNPEAFGQDNINNLKVGSVLRAPDQDTLNQLSKQEAYAQVLEQNGLWDDYVARTTGSATTGSPAALDEEQVTEEQAEGQLTLLTPDEGDSGSASMQDDANSQDAGKIRKQLALAEEELEASRLENDELKSRISDLEQQIAKFEELQKLVQIEDDSLAQMQQDQATESVAEADESMVAEIEEQPTDVMIEAADAIMAEQEQGEQVESDASVEEVAEAEADQLVDETVETTGPDGMLAEETETETEVETEIAETGDQAMEELAGEEVMADEEAMTEEQEQATVPAPVIVTEAPVTSTDGGVLDMLPSLDSLLSDPIMLGGIGAILALLIGFLFLKRKKGDDDDSTITVEEPETIQDEDATPIHLPTAEDAEPDEKREEPEEALVDTEQHMADTVAVEAEESDEEELNKTAVLSAEELPSAEGEGGATEQDDVLNEVDVYLAYGLYDNAEELLKENLQSSPDRADYRAKLLDTYFATKNADGFVKEAEALKSLGGAADRFWNRVQIMGYELAPDNELFAGAKDSEISAADLEYAKPDVADFDIGSEEDITDFSNTDFDLSDDSDNYELTDTQVVPPGVDDFTSTQSVDEVELPDLDAEDEATALREEVKAEEVELPDEIGDFDLDLGEESDVSEIEENLDEDALSFDLPEDVDLSTTTDDSLIPLDPTVEAPDLDKVPPMDETDAVVLDFDTSDTGEDADESEIDIDFGVEEEQAAESEAEPEKSEDESATDETVAMSSVEKAEQEVDPEGTMHVESALDMDMSDLENADLNTGTFKPTEPEAGLEDDITEFKPAEVTGEFTAFDPEADAAVAEIDADAGLDKTGTYAPGDFEDDEIDAALDAIDESDEIEDLMLPDDVDEVATKLDLAKAFIDMGDAEGAKSSLEEVLSEGTQEQKAEATGLLNKIQ